ncbi:hypothetical protein F2P81_006513, partial [Scophthalmus maximus]
MDGPTSDPDLLNSPSPSPPPLFHCDYTDWSPSLYIIPSVYLLAFLSCPSRALLILGGVWLLAGLLALPGLLLRSVRELELDFESEDDWQPEPVDSGSVFLSCQMDYSMLIGAGLEEAEQERAEMWWAAALSLKSTLIGFLLPLVILLVCYCSLAQLLSRHFGRGPRPDRRRQRRLLRVIVTLVMAFFLCWLPLHVNKTVSLLLEFGFVPYSCSLDQILLAAQPYVTCLAYLNSCLNPLLYAACDPSFKKRCIGAILMLCKTNRRGAEGGEGEKDEGDDEKGERSSEFPTRTQEETADRTEEEMVEEAGSMMAEGPACKIEVPERLTVSHEALVESGLADRCVSVPVREATEADILQVHSEEYLEGVKKTPYMTLEDLKEFTLQYGDVYFHPNIYHCAKLAAGAALQLVDSVMTGKVRNGMALVRPPGHHSMRSAASGFCVFNNVAIAAQYAKQKYGVKRVLIVDWDVHHGQGVQHCFEDDPSVLYFSWHRYEHQKFWPNLRESDFDCVGKEKGAGFNVNVPWNEVKMQNSDYLSVFCHLLLPVAYEFCPDLVLVCAGFDSAIGDPEGEMCATPDIFAHLTHLLMNLAGGKLCALLEGGYNLTCLAQSVCQTVHTLLGDPAPRPADLHGPCKSALESLHCARAAHRQYWACLKHAADLPTSDISTKRIRLGEEDEKPLDTEEELVWPEPPKRLAPALRTAVVLPGGVACPDGCNQFSSSEELDPVTVNKLTENLLKDVDESDALSILSSLIALVEKMEKNEICTGLALVQDISMAMMCVVQHAASAPDNRKTLVVHFSNKESEKHKGRYYIPVCLKKGFSDTSGFIQAVLGLLLPLGYEYDPGLVLLVRMSAGGLCDGVWQQLTGLLLGLAHGHTLVLMQDGERAPVGPTASSLLGDPAPSLGPLLAPLPEDVAYVENLRHMLSADWKLLQTTVDNHVRPVPHPDVRGRCGAGPSVKQMKPLDSTRHVYGREMAGLLCGTKRKKQEENAERIMLDPTSRENLKFKDLLKVLIDWINSELEEDRIIVKDLEEDCYDGQVLQKIFEKLSGRKLNVAEVTQSEIGQKQKLQTVLEAVNDLLRPHGWTSEWSVDSIHAKNLVAIVYLLVALAMHFQAPIRLPEHVSVQVVVVKNDDGKICSSNPLNPRIFTTERDAFDTLLDHAPDKLNVVKTSLITFVNKHLNKLNLEVTELESQFADGVYLILLMGLLEDYFVPLYNFFLTPESFEQKVHNVAFAFELMQDGGLKKPKARPD